MRRRIYDDFFFLLLAFAFYGVIRLLSPFSGALMGALICVVTFYPMHQSLQRWFPRPAVRAVVSEVLVVLFFVIPVVLLIWISFVESAALLDLLHQGSSIFTRWRDGNTEFPTWISGSPFLHLLGIEPLSLKQHAILVLNHWLEYATTSVSLIVGHVVLFASNIFIMLFALFFFFRDGETIFIYLENLIPLRREHKQHIMRRMRDTVIAVVRGGLFTSLLQGVLATIAYGITGAAAPFLLGALTIIMGLVPVIGTFSVWGALAIYFIAQASYMKGLFLLLWGTIVVAGVTDILIRPYLVGRRAHVPIFPLFFALLGGLEVWGIKGLILGPVLAALLPELLTIYRLRYLRKDDEEEKT